MSPLVSILIPCFNSERYVAAAIRSALGQTWETKEIIVVDDGSTDDSLRICREYEKDGVRVLTQRNRGASAARNAALAEAKGDYLQFLDADDLLTPDKIAAQVALLENAEPGMVAYASTIYFAGDVPVNGTLADGWPMIDSDDPLGWLIELHGPDRHGGMVHPGSWLVPAGVARQAGPWNEALSLDDDGEYFARVVLASTGLRRSAQGSSCYRKHPEESGNLSAQRGAEAQSSALLSLDLRAAAILSRRDSPPARRALARAYKQRAFLAFPYSKEISESALANAAQLGDTSSPAEFGTWKGRLLAAVFGWRTIRRANVLFHRAYGR